MIEYIDKLTPDPNAPNPSEYETEQQQIPAGANLPDDFPKEEFEPAQLDILEHYYFSRLPQLAAHLLTALKSTPHGEGTLEEIGANVHILLQALGLEPLPPLSYLAAAIRTRKDTLLKQRRFLIMRIARTHRSPDLLSDKQRARTLLTIGRMLKEANTQEA